MSSPVSSLKKSRKNPFPTYGASGKNVPYRNSSYTSDENRLLEEITGKMASNKLKDIKSSTDGSLTKTSGTSKTAPSDNELMTLMMTRVGQLEQKIQFQATEISEKDKKLRIAEEKAKILQRTQDRGDPGRLHQLEKKCLLLQQHVHEMETFLADYGMVWVGSQENPGSAVYNSDGDSMGDDDEEMQWHPADSVPGQNKFKVDYNLIIENIKDLNQLAEEGVAHIEHVKDGARLKVRDPIQLTLYANGILMFSGPFRPFSDPETQQCATDLMDGYFPSELQARYPDGIPFKVTDKRDVHFKDKNRKAFVGTGQILGGETKPSRLVPSHLDKGTTYDVAQDTATESKAPGPQFTMEQFLNRLPQSVIKQGKVIDIRDGVGTTLKGSTGSSSSITVLETTAVKDMKTRVTEDDRKSANPRDIATLRIKSEKGDNTYIVKMKFTDTIGDVKRYLNKARPRGSPAYHIVSAFPSRQFDNDTETLQACGLVPNATLHLRPKK